MQQQIQPLLTTHDWQTRLSTLASRMYSDFKANAQRNLQEVRRVVLYRGALSQLG